jgi:hypothetical protein
MSATGTRAWSLTAAGIRLAGSARLAGAVQARPAADLVAEGARKIVQGVQESAKGIGHTQTEGATEVEQRAKAASAEARPAGAKLEMGARGFGESIWHSMRSVSRSLQTFFTGS